MEAPRSGGGAVMGMPWVCQAARLLGCLVIDAIIPTYIFPQTGLTCMGFVLL